MLKGLIIGVSVLVSVISNVRCIEGTVIVNNDTGMYISTVDGQGWNLDAPDIKEWKDIKPDEPCKIIFDNMGTTNDIYDDEIIDIITIN